MAIFRLHTAPRCHHKFALYVQPAANQQQPVSYQIRKPHAPLPVLLQVRVVTERAYHALFMHNMLIRPTDEELADFGEPDFIIYNAGRIAGRLSAWEWLALLGGCLGQSQHAQTSGCVESSSDGSYKNHMHTFQSDTCTVRSSALLLVAGVLQVLSLPIASATT
jgi:hypothetical protein